MSLMSPRASNILQLLLLKFKTLRTAVRSCRSTMTHPTSILVFLVPVRFITTMGHLLAISLVKQSLNDNIRASIEPHFSRLNELYQEPYPYSYPIEPNQPYYEQYQNLRTSTTAAIITSYLCLTIDIIGLVTGVTIFMNRINLFQSFVHFWGGVFTCWFVMYGMRVEMLWSIVGWTAVPTCFVELINLFLFYYRRKQAYQDIDSGSQTHEA